MDSGGGSRGGAGPAGAGLTAARRGDAKGIVEANLRCASIKAMRLPMESML